ncbi:DNA-binding domain-containing protein [Bacillus sp. NP157]|nr:DNA-binding domain-containing protein [Bacillus sp. NP157]
MNLRDMQSQFASVLRGAPAVDGLDGRGMAIYTNNYRSQLVASLRDTYAKTRLWIGDGQFDEMAESYVASTPPASWTLDAYGESFIDWLDKHYPEDIEIAELAWLDWHLRRAFSGADAEPISVNDLVSVDWDATEFRFVPTLKFRWTRSNATAIWHALASESMPPASEVFDVDAGVRVWRRDYSPRFTSMLAPECACLDLALAGASFGELCEALTRLHEPDTAARQAGALLRSWVDDGIVLSLQGG